MLEVSHLVFHITYTGSLFYGLSRMAPSLSLSYLVPRPPLPVSATVGICHIEGVPRGLQYIPRLAWLVVIPQAYQKVWAGLNSWKALFALPLFLCDPLLPHGLQLDRRNDWSLHRGPRQPMNRVCQVLLCLVGLLTSEHLVGVPWMVAADPVQMCYLLSPCHHLGLEQSFLIWLPFS